MKKSKVVSKARTLLNELIQIAIAAREHSTHKSIQLAIAIEAELNYTINNLKSMVEEAKWQKKHLNSRIMENGEQTIYYKDRDGNYKSRIEKI